MKCALTLPLSVLTALNEYESANKAEYSSPFASLKYAWSDFGIVKGGFLSVVALKQHQRQEQAYF